MYELGVVYRNIQRADRKTADGLAKFGASTVHEAMGRVGLMKPYMRPIYPGAQISGTAGSTSTQTRASRCHRICVASASRRPSSS